MNDGRGGRVSTVIDAETDSGPERLDPDKSLHENNVRDRGKLRVGTKVVAGSISPELRMEAQLRTRAQIRRYVLSHPAFSIADYDNEDLPNRLTLRLEGTGSRAAGGHRRLPGRRREPQPRRLPRAALGAAESGPDRVPPVHHAPERDVPRGRAVRRVEHPRVPPEHLAQAAAGRPPGAGVPRPAHGRLPARPRLRLPVPAARRHRHLPQLRRGGRQHLPRSARRPVGPYDAGQRVIQSLGGPPMRPSTQRDDEKPVAPALWLSPLAGRPTGDAQ